MSAYCCQWITPVFSINFEASCCDEFWGWLLPWALLYNYPGFLTTALWSHHPSGTAEKFYSLWMCWGKYITIRMPFCSINPRLYVVLLLICLFHHIIVGKLHISAWQTQISLGIFLPWMGTILLPVTTNAKFINNLAFWSGETSVSILSVSIFFSVSSSPVDVPQIKYGIVIEKAMKNITWNRSNITSPIFRCSDKVYSVFF